MIAYLRQFKNRRVAEVQKKYPDWDITIALRYLPIVRDLRTNFPTSVKILEVGSGEFGILPYLDPAYKNFTGADVDFGAESQKNRMKMVHYTGFDLPFKDQSFDICICVDTLEHIPGNHRRHFVSELSRVTRTRLYLAFPSGYFASLADSLLAKYYFKNYHREYPYLQEHHSYGLPDSGPVEAGLTSSGWKTRSFGNTNFFIWVKLLFLGFSKFPVLTTVFILMAPLTDFFSFFNIPPYYRTMIIADRV